MSKLLSHEEIEFLLADMAGMHNRATGSEPSPGFELPTLEAALRLVKSRFFLLVGFPLLIVLPVVGLVRMNELVGFPIMLAEIVITGLLGILVLRRQGLDALRSARRRLLRSEPPAAETLDALLLFAAGVLLLLPMPLFVEDALGALLLLRPVRTALAPLLRSVLAWMLVSGPEL